MIYHEVDTHSPDIGSLLPDETSVRRPARYYFRRSFSPPLRNCLQEQWVYNGPMCKQEDKENPGGDSAAER